MFKESFKYYKAKYPTPDFSEVVDFDKPNDDIISRIPVHLLNTMPPGIKPIDQWNCYELKSHPGLLFIRNPFTCKGQRYWIIRCLQDYPKYPNINNLKNLENTSYPTHIINDWWKSLQNENCNKKFNEKLKISMRWTTLGYHHNWDTKIYNEKYKNKFPDDLSKLCKFFAKILKFENYSAEAAIVNYYPIGTTLAGHTDHSELDLDAPLFSFSFGQTAIFLIGGKTKEEKPAAIFLKSGDIVIMSKSSRLCYHAVPRVMKSEQEPWNDKDNEDAIHQYNKIINELNDDDDDDHITKNKKLKFNEQSLPENVKNNFLDQKLWEKCLNDENYWIKFNDYLKDSRININVRQVLKEGQTSL